VQRRGLAGAGVRAFSTRDWVSHDSGLFALSLACKARPQVFIHELITKSDLFQMEFL
jgi:hypothetical protein